MRHYLCVACWVWVTRDAGPPVEACYKCGKRVEALAEAGLNVRLGERRQENLANTGTFMSAMEWYIWNDPFAFNNTPDSEG